MSEPPHLAASRTAYDHSAELYSDVVGVEVNDQFEAPLDRAVLQSFVELVKASGPGVVLDAGCGRGRVAAFLSRNGLEACGIDLSERMISEARRSHPNIPFAEGSLTALGVAEGSLVGVAYWYSIITTPPAELPAVWTELRRAAAPGAQVLVGFQAGQGEAVQRPGAYGSSVTLTLYRHDVEYVSRTMQAAGFEVQGDVRRQPTLPHEESVQAFLLCALQGEI